VKVRAESGSGIANSPSARPDLANELYKMHFSLTVIQSYADITIFKAIILQKRPYVMLITKNLFHFEMEK